MTATYTPSQADAQPGQGVAALARQWSWLDRSAPSPTKPIQRSPSPRRMLHTGPAQIDPTKVAILMADLSASQ